MQTNLLYTMYSEVTNRKFNIFKQSHNKYHNKLIQIHQNMAIQLGNRI